VEIDATLIDGPAVLLDPLADNLTLIAKGLDQRAGRHA
jgi:hypothetical protein